MGKLLSKEQIIQLIKKTGWGLERAHSVNLVSNYTTVAQAQLDLDEERFDKDREEIRQEERERIKRMALQSIADEPEFPSKMPDEVWQELDGNRGNVEKAMKGAVRLTKNGITKRFLEALKTKPLQEKE